MAVRVRAVLLLLLALLASQAALARKFGVTTDDEGKPALEEGDVQAKDPTHITDKATTALASSPPKPVLEVPTAPPGVSGPAGNGKKSKAGLTTPPEYSFIQPVKKGEAAPPSKQPPAPSKEPGPPKEPASQKDPQFHLPTKKDTTVPSTVGKPAPSKEDPPTSKEETSPPPKKDPNPPPKEDTAPPPKNGGNPPAKKETNPPPKTDPAAVPKNDGNPPPKNEVNPPPKKETNPPPKKDTNPPPKKETNPPPKKETNPPPKKEANPPPKKETNPPPKKEVNPPPKKDNTPAPKNHSGTGPEKPVPPPKQESPSSPKKHPKPTPATTKEGGKSEAPPQKPPQPSSDVELIPPQKIRPTWTPPHEYIIPKGFECINFGPVRQPGMIQYTASDIIGGHVRSFSVPHDRFPKLPTAFLSHVYGKHFKYVLRTGHKNPKRAFDLLLGFAEVYPDLCGKNAKKREFSLHAGRHWRKVNAKASVGCGKQLKIPLKAVASTDGTIVFTFKAYAENAMVSLICYSPTYIPHKTTTANSKPPSNKPVTQVISKSNEKKNTQKPTTKSNNKVGTEKQSPSSPVPLPSVALPKPSVSSPAKDTSTDPAPKEDTAGKTTTPVTQVEAPASKDTSSAPTPKTDNSGNTTTPVTKVEALAPKDKTTAPDLKTVQAGNKTSPVTKVETPASGTSGGEALDTIDGLSKQQGVKCVNFGKGIVKGFAAATWTAFSGNVSYYTSSTAIKDTSLSESFQSHAFGEAFSYALAVPKMGTYNLALGFAETFDLVCKSPTPNFRLFTVAAGSQTKIMAIYGTAGCNTAYTEILHGVKSETGSVITIGFEASENNAMISNLCFWESNTKLAVPKGDGKPVTKSVAIPSVQVPAASVGIATKEDSVPSAVSGKNSTAEKPSPKASTSASASAAVSSMPSASAAASASVSASSSASAAASVSASASPSVSASAKPKKQNPPVTKEDPKPSSSPVPEDKPPAAGKPAKESPLPKFTRGVIEDTQGGHGSGKSVPAIVSTKNSTKATTKQDSETSDKNPTEGKAPKGSPLPKVTTGVIEDTRGGHGSGPNILIENNNTMLDWGDGGKSNGTDLSKGKFEAVNGTKTDVVITIFSSKAPIPSTNASAPDVGVKAPVLGSSAPAAPVLEESPNGGVAIPVIVDPPAIATREPPQKTQDILVLFPSASLTPGTAAPSPSAPPTSDPTTTGPSPSILVLLPPPGVQPPQASPTAAKSPDITVGSPNASTSAVVSPTPVESSDVSITIGNVTAPAPSVLPSVPVDPSPTSDGDISVPEIPTGNDTGISLPSIISASPSASSGNDTNGDISVPSIISASPSASSGNDTNGDINVPSLISASPSPGGISVPSIVLPSPGVGAGNQTGPGDIGNGGADASSSAVPTPSIGTDNGSVAAIPIIVAPTQNPDSTSAANIVLLPLPSGVTPPSPSPTPMEIVTAIPLVPQNSTGTAASSGNDNDFVITIPGGDTSQVLMGAPINSSGPSPKPEPLSFSDQKQVAASPSASASTSPSASMSMSASPAASASSSVSPSISVSPSVSMSPKPPTSKTGGNEIITIDNSPVPSGSVTPPLPSVDPAIIEVPESPRPQPSVQAKTAPPTAAPTAVIVGPYAEAVGLRKYSNSAFPVLMGIIGSLLIIMLITCLYFAIFAGRRNRSNSNASQYTYQGDDYDRPQGNNYGATLGAQGGYPVATGYEDESDLGARIQSGSAASDPAYPNGSNAGSAPSGQGTYDQEADEFGPYGAAPMGGAPNLNDHELSADGSGNAYSMGGGAGEQTMEDVPLGYGPVDPNGQQDNSFEFAQDGAPGATHALPQMQQHSFEEDHSIARPDRIGSESSGNEERQTMSTEHEDDDDMFSDYGNERPAGMNGKSNSQHVRDQLANIHRQIASQLAANSSRSSSGAEDFTPRDSQGSGADKSGVPASQQSSSVARQSNSTDDDTNELCYKDTCDDDNGEGANKEQDPENVEGASDPWPFWYNAPRAGPHASTYHQAGGNRGAAMGGPALLASVRDKLIATQAPETIDERDEETNSDTSWIRRKRSVGTAEPPVPPPAEDAAPASGPIFGAPTLAQRWPAGGNSESENSSVTGSAKYSDGLSSTSSGKPPAGGGEFPVALRPATGGAPTLQDISGRAAYNQTMLQAGTGKRVAFWEGAQAPQVELGAVGSVPFQPADPERNRFSQRFGQPRASAEPVVPVDVEELRKRREPNVKEAAKRLSQATHRSSSSMQSSVIR